MFKEIRNQRARRREKRFLVALIRTYNQVKRTFQSVEVKTV